MNCQSVHESLVALLDGEVEASERAALDGHLAACAECRRERDLLEATRALVTHGLRGAAVTGGSFDALWQRLEGEPAAGSAQRVVPLGRGGGSVVSRPRARTASRTTAAWVAAGGFAAAAGLALALLGLPGTDEPVPGSPAVPVAAAPQAAPERVAVARAPATERGRDARRAPRAPAAPARAGKPVPESAASPPQDETADAATAVARGEADPPRDLLERPDLFVNYTIMRKLDELRHLDAVLAESPDDGKQGGAG